MDSALLEWQNSTVLFKSLMEKSCLRHHFKISLAEFMAVSLSDRTLQVTAVLSQSPGRISEHQMNISERFPYLDHSSISAQQNMKTTFIFRTCFHLKDIHHCSTFPMRESCFSCLGTLIAYCMCYLH